MVQTIGFTVMQRMNDLSELEEYGYKGMDGTIQGLVHSRVLPILENRALWPMVSNAALRSSRISIRMPCWPLLLRMSFSTFTGPISVL